MMRFRYGFVLLCLLLQAPVRGAPRVIAMKAVSGLAYDLKRFQVAPGEAVRLELKNADAMMHNLVIARPGSRAAVVQAALELGADGPEKEYVPDTPDVLRASRVLEPGQAAVLEFTAPEEEGVYPYVCTYPGHGFVMYGAMYVGTGPLPPEADDPHLPALPASTVAGNTVSNTTRVVREFMPHCGPAAIAVGFVNQTSLCWDAGLCRPRYAWQGGFIEIPYIKNDRAKLLGTRWLRFEEDQRLTIEGGGAEGPPDFLGYRLEGGNPEFAYRLSGVKVKARYEPLPESASGFQVAYTVAPGKHRVRFRGPGEIRMKGRAHAGPLDLDGEEGVAFVVRYPAPEDAARERRGR